MTTRPLYAYEYAHVPYEDVIELLATDATAVLSDATATTVEHAEDVVTEIHVELGGFEVGRDVVVEVGEFEPAEILRGRLPLRWRAAQGAGLFPAVEANLEVAALSVNPPRTQITLVGSYEPPLGRLGAAADAAAGHRVAEAAMKRFVEDVVRRVELRAPQSSSASNASSSQSRNG